MLSLLCKLQRCPLTLLCDEAGTAHATVAALHHVAAAATCCFVTLERPPAWFAQFPQALVVDGLAVLGSGAGDTAGEPLPILEALCSALEGQAAVTVVLHSASAFLALYGAAALHHFCVKASSLAQVRNVVCVVHADAHPAAALACQAQQSSAVLMLAPSHTASRFQGTPLQALVPRPPPLPDVPYDVCGVALVRRPLQRTAKAPDEDCGGKDCAQPAIGARTVSRLLSLTEYFTLAEAAAPPRLHFAPVDWRAAVAPARAGPTAVAAGAAMAAGGTATSALEGLLGLQAQPEAPFQLRLTAEERRAREALVLPSARGAAAAPTPGVIYVDPEDFDDDLDDDLDI